MPSDYAAGLKAVVVALQHTISQMGTMRSMRALASLNQKKGFDCPGCAWPDPDDKRSLFAEYCENGAKAVAEEATLKRADPFFFTQHRISEMLEWTDFEIGKSGRLTHPMIKHPGADYYEPISWSDAYQLIGKELNGLKAWQDESKHDQHSIEFTPDYGITPLEGPVGFDLRPVTIEDFILPMDSPLRRRGENGSDIGVRWEKFLQK